eukprot:408030-Hanusia_phi.AAC.3
MSFLQRSLGPSEVSLSSLRSGSEQVHASASNVGYQMHSDRRWTSTPSTTGSVGIVFRQLNGENVVIDVIKGSSAAESRAISIGDILEVVNGQSVHGVPYQEVMEMVVGPAGSVVNLVIRSATQGVTKLKDVALVRRQAFNLESGTPVNGSSMPKLNLEGIVKGQDSLYVDITSNKDTQLEGMEQLLSAARRRIKDLEHEIAQRNLESRLWPATPRTPKNVQLARALELESSREASCYQRWPCLEPLGRAKDLLEQLALQESRYSNMEKEETATEVSYDHYSMAENETFQSIRTALDSAFKSIFEQLEVQEEEEGED